VSTGSAVWRVISPRRQSILTESDK